MHGEGDREFTTGMLSCSWAGLSGNLFWTEEKRVEEEELLGLGKSRGYLGPMRGIVETPGHLAAASGGG